MKKKEEVYSFPQQKDGAVVETDIRMIPLEELQDFEGHPFKVENDMALFELMLSIEKEGVIVPALARPKADGGYELIAGHRRKVACKWAGLDSMPVVIRDLDDNQAVIAMVDSNLQREHLKPSEKAFAYKMKLEAMKRQGARTDLTSSKTVTETSDQVGPKLDNPTLVTHGLASNYDSEGKWSVVQKETNTDCNIRSNELLARQVGESVNQIKRYIRLTNLIPKVLDMVDEGKIAFTIAVELSFLTEEQQYELYEVMDEEQCTPSLSQANRIRFKDVGGVTFQEAKEAILTYEEFAELKELEVKKKDSEQVVDDSNEYVDDYTVDTEIIEQPVIKADIVPKVEPILEDVSTIPEEPIDGKTTEKDIEPEPVDFKQLSIKERAELLSKPTDDIMTEFNAYCKRMGYTEEKMRSIRYKMALYDDFSEEFNYRKKHYGVRETSRIVEVHEKNRGAR